MKREPVILGSKTRVKRIPVTAKDHDTIKRSPVILDNSVGPATENKKLKKGKQRRKGVSDKRKNQKSSVAGPLIISYTDPSEDPDGFKKAKKEVLKDFAKAISNESGWLESLTETPTDLGFKPTELYPYQRDHMGNYAKYRWMNKSRQIGASYGFSGEGLAKSHLMDIYTAIFVSYNQEEANEKINYARAMYESLPLKYQRKCIVDRVTALEFEKRTGSRRYITRLISHPQRAVRGKGGNVDVFLDEFAHFTWDVKIYVAAVPVITRGFGQITIASSPLGKIGLHWQIGEDRKLYPTFSRQYVFWWMCRDFLNDEAQEKFDEVQVRAPLMETEERVFEFGNEAIIQAYVSSLPEDFGQEYELRPFDERESYYPLYLIKTCTFESLEGEPVEQEIENYGDSPQHLQPVHKGLKYKTFDDIDELARAVSRGKVSKFLYGGYDVGRHEDAAELIILEELRDYDNFQMLRLALSGRRMEFEKQQDLIMRVFKKLPIRNFKIDVTGMGKQLGEFAKKRYGSRIDCVDFNNTNKQDMATDIKIRMEDQMIGYPSDKNLIRQIHSIKREVTQTNLVRFVPEESRTHHGDKFWALAMASAAGSPVRRLISIGTSKSIAVKSTANVIVLDSKRKFPKNKDDFILPVGIERPPLHIQSLGASILRMKR